MVADIRRQIEAKIEDATLERSPFPHLVIENFFPDYVYQKMLQYNPFLSNRGQEWMAAEASDNVSSRTPYHARKQINFHANVALEAAPDAAQFWGNLKSCFLGDNWFESVVAHKYSEYFNLRFGDLVDDPKFFTYFRKELFLQRHDPGYYIGPHTDIPTRIFTCIFSFADRHGYEDFGTELLAHNDPLVRCWGNDHYAPDDFVIKKIAPYRPNNFLLFFKTRHSFHSVRAITEDVPNQRYGMQFQLYEPPKGVFRDLSVPDLLATKQRPIAPPEPPMSLTAKRATYIKTTTAMAASLSVEQKIAVSAGDIVNCVRCQIEGSHTKLVGAVINGRQLAERYIYTPDWDPV
jgi:hypothetical protein